MDFQGRVKDADKTLGACYEKDENIKKKSKLVAGIANTYEDKLYDSINQYCAFSFSFRM